MNRTFRLAMSILAVWVLLLGLSTTVSAAPKKVDICHIPPGNPLNFHTISVGAASVATHTGHGDIIGKAGCKGIECKLCITLCTSQADENSISCKDELNKALGKCHDEDDACRQDARVQFKNCINDVNLQEKECNEDCKIQHCNSK